MLDIICFFLKNDKFRKIKFFLNHTHCVFYNIFSENDYDDLVKNFPDIGEMVKMEDPKIITNLININFLQEIIKLDLIIF